MASTNWTPKIASDLRIVSDFAGNQAIATSSGQNDNGVFELNFRDERYLPFEGAGAVSRWRIELDRDCNRFDVETVPDVLLHFKYSAKPGGQLLAQKAKAAWQKIAGDSENVVFARLISLRYEFPSEWYRLQTVANESGDHVQTFAIAQNRFPMLFQHANLTLSRFRLLGMAKFGTSVSKLPTVHTPKPDDALVTFADGVPIGNLVHKVGTVTVSVKENNEEALWTLSVAKADVAGSLQLLNDVIVVCEYSVTSKTN